MMTIERKQAVVRLAKRVVWPLAVMAAFALGAVCTRGAGLDGHAPTADDHKHGDDNESDKWTCSMHPNVRADGPGSCPICGMDLIPVAHGDGATDSPRHVSLSEAARVRARIRTAPVKRLHSGSVERRLLGKVDYDETRLRTVTSWITGRIDRLHVRATGQRVRRWQTIATLYSPEVFGAHQDLLVAKRQVAALAGATAVARDGAQAAFAAARDRLRLLGVPSSEITAMEKAKRPWEHVRIRSRFTGTVIKRLATEGVYVKTGTGLYQVADLSRVWVQLDAYESDLPLLKVGQSVSLKVEALPSQAFDGRVMFVDPVLNKRTRTTRVRIEVKNTGGHLRPGMFAEATVHGKQAAESALVIPDTAPLFTGRRSIVYVEVPNKTSPTYEARVVRLGLKTGDSYAVIAGLSAGERVVVHGAFTLDADLQIRGGLSMMTAADDSEEGAFDSIVQIPTVHQEPLSKLVSAYLALHEALADDKLADAVTAIEQLSAIAEPIQPKSPVVFRDAWMPVRRQLLTHAKHVRHAKSLDEARLGFRDISQQVATLLRVFGNPTTETVRLASCPMALEGQGAEWVQRASEIENPYFGVSMHSCGEVHESVEHGSYLPVSKSADKTENAAPSPAGHRGHNH